KYTQVKAVKSLVFVEHPGDIEELYVPCSLQHRSETLSELSFFDSLPRSPKCVVMGTAGMGKSFFLRHTFVRQFHTRSIGLPLYLELRALNESSSSIYDYILREIGQSNKTLIKELLTLGLRAGLFILLLDGFDELNLERIRSIQSEIARFAAESDQMRIV